MDARMELCGLESNCRDHQGLLLRKERARSSSEIARVGREGSMVSQRASLGHS